MTRPPGLFAGTDLGGTKILTVIAGRDAGIIGEDVRATPAEAGSRAVLAALIDSLRDACAAARVTLPDLTGIGVSVAAPIDAERGLVTKPPNFENWEEIALAREVSSATGVPARMDNDANCGGLGEWYFGAGRGARHLVYVTLGTGFGGAIILDGRLYTGANGTGGELGHMVVNAAGRRCHCGNQGCIEAYCSGVALAELAGDLLAAGRAPLLRGSLGGAEPDARAVLAAAAAGDADCAALVEQAAFYLGAQLSSLVNAFNPERIVVGGSVARAWEQLIAPAVGEMERRAFPAAVRVVRVVPGTLGGEACALGATALARQA